jgi:hypothetical protein
MRQVDRAAAQHLLSPFSSPFYGVKLLYDWVLRNERSDWNDLSQNDVKAGKKAKPERRPEGLCSLMILCNGGQHYIPGC